MKHIIIPTDFSENAYNAITYAMQLFKDAETKFYLLHAISAPIFQVEFSVQGKSEVGQGDPDQEEVLAQLNELVARLQEEFKNPKHSFETRAPFISLIDAILILSKKEKADLVIMGTQGVTNAKEIIFGTNATQVIKRTNCPVIAVPSGFEYDPPKTILFPTDYEIEYDKDQMHQLLEIAKKHESRIDVLHISSGSALNEEALQNKQKLKDLLSQTDLIFNDLPKQEVLEGINQFQNEKAIDLLVMVRNKRTFFERLFVAPIIKKIGFFIDIPFMVIPYDNK